MVAEVKAVLEGVQVVDDEPARPPAAREVREEAREGGGRGDDPFLDDALHGAGRVKGEHDRHRFDERLEQRDERVELRQGHVVVVERRHEEHVLAAEPGGGLFA